MKAQLPPITVSWINAFQDRVREALIAAGGEIQNRLSRDTGQVYGIIDPDYGRIYTMVRKLAWEEGYAIGLHGSFTRDLDLIAVPWVEKPAAPEHLVARILDATGLESLHSNPCAKPQGRRAWTLLLPKFGDPRFVDLSIMEPSRMNVMTDVGPSVD
jgi:hypothetical protein